MNAPITQFGPAALADLRARTEYEAWLLEAVYEISNQRLAVERDELIYPPAGGPPTQTIYAVANIALGDWRPGFLEAGAPLVFVTAFKLLDMLLEWILAENGQTATHRFAQKIAALKGSVRFPTLIGSRPWLRDRLVALYDQLEPLRGTVIHTRHFKGGAGTLQVSSSKGGTVGPVITLGPTDLRNLALVLVSLLRYLDGTWAMDLLREKRIHRALDEVAHLHGLPTLGQLPPGFLTVRVYVTENDPIECDLGGIRRDVSAKRHGQDVLFDLRIIAVAPDGTRAAAYLLPWDQLQNCSPQLRETVANLAPYIVALPDDLDLVAVASEIRRRP